MEPSSEPMWNSFSSPSGKASAVVAIGAAPVMAYVTVSQQNGAGKGIRLTWIVQKK
jgi:hypothetical protein